VGREMEDDVRPCACVGGFKDKVWDIVCWWGEEEPRRPRLFMYGPKYEGGGGDGGVMGCFGLYSKIHVRLGCPPYHGDAPSTA